MDILEDQFNKTLNNIGVDINIVNTPCFFKEFDDKNYSHDYKYIFAPIGQVKQGNLIYYENNYYIVINTQNEHSKVYTKACIRKCNYIIKLYINDILYQIPVCIDTANSTINNNNYMSTLEGKAKITVSDSIINRQIEQNMRFIAFGKAYKIIDTENLNGIITLTAEIGAIDTQTDDQENEIADRWKHEIKNNYTINILNTTNSINVGDTLQLDVQVKDNDKIIESKFTYKSNNTDIATVDENGLITAIAEGNCNIIVSSTDIENLTATYSLEVIKTVEEKIYTIEIQGEDSCIIENQAQYTAIVKLNGNEVNDKTVLWSYEDVSGGKVKIVKSEGLKCTIEGLEYGDINLIATLSDDDTIICKKKITIRNWF